MLSRRSFLAVLAVLPTLRFFDFNILSTVEPIVSPALWTDWDRLYEATARMYAKDVEASIFAANPFFQPLSSLDGRGALRMPLIYEGEQDAESWH